MSYQIRHKDHGIYQGSFLGMGFWHPVSEMPEQGFCEFPTEQAANEFVHFLLTESSGPMEEGSLTVEPFDKETSDRLIHEAANTGS